MHTRNRTSGNGYRSHSMVTGGVATGSRISPENSLRGQGAHRSDYRSFSPASYGRGPSRQFHRPPQQKHGDIFMEAGRLATEYLVSKGLMPPNVLTGKSQNDSFKNQAAADGMQLPLEGRTSALTRLGAPVSDVGPGRTRYQDDSNSLSSNGTRGRRSGSLKNYGPDWNREFGRIGSLADKSRASADVDGEKDTFSSHHGEQKVTNEGESVSQDHTPEGAPEKDSGAKLVSTLEKQNLVDAGVNARSSSSEKDLSMLGDVELLENTDNTDPHPEAGEIKDGEDHKRTDKDDIAVGEAEKVDSISSESGCALLKLCSFAKVPTKTRSWMALRGSKVDADVMTMNVDTLQNEPPKESGSCIEDIAADGLHGNDSSILELDNLEVPSMVDASGDCKKNFPNNTTASISDIDKSSPKDRTINDKLPECVIVSTSERGEKRALNDENIKEENKKPRESPAFEESESEKCLRLSDSLEKQPTSEESVALEDGTVLLHSDEKRLLDISLFPKGDIESCMDYTEEKQLFPASFKTCDLNLMEASDVHENHVNNTVLLVPSATERGKQPIPVDIDLSMSNNSLVSNNFSECSIVGKDIEVIDLENEPEQEDRDFSNSKRRSENVFSCLDGYSNNTHNGNDISDVQDGYGLMISELLGNDIPNCSSVPTDMNLLHGGMGLHSGEGILADDDSIYMSLGEIPISFLRVWEQQPNQDFGKPY